MVTRSKSLPSTMARRSWYIASWCLDPVTSSERLTRSSRRSPMVLSTVTPSFSPRLELGSASTARMTFPVRAASSCTRRADNVDFPTPPLPATAMM